MLCRVFCYYFETFDKNPFPFRIFFNPNLISHIPKHIKNIYILTNNTESESETITSSFLKEIYLLFKNSNVEKIYLDYNFSN